MLVRLPADQAMGGAMCAALLEKFGIEDSEPGDVLDVLDVLGGGGDRTVLDRFALGEWTGLRVTKAQQQSQPEADDIEVDAIDSFNRFEVESRPLDGIALLSKMTRVWLGHDIADLADFRALCALNVMNALCAPEVAPEVATEVVPKAAKGSREIRILPKVNIGMKGGANLFLSIRDALAAAREAVANSLLLNFFNKERTLKITRERLAAAIEWGQRYANNNGGETSLWQQRYANDRVIIRLSKELVVYLNGGWAMDRVSKAVFLAINAAFDIKKLMAYVDDIVADCIGGVVVHFDTVINAVDRFHFAYSVTTEEDMFAPDSGYTVYGRIVKEGDDLDAISIGDGSDGLRGFVRLTSAEGTMEVKSEHGGDVVRLHTVVLDKDNKVIFNDLDTVDLPDPPIGDMTLLKVTDVTSDTVSVDFAYNNNSLFIDRKPDEVPMLRYLIMKKDVPLVLAEGQTLSEYMDAKAYSMIMESEDGGKTYQANVVNTGCDVYEEYTVYSMVQDVGTNTKVEQVDAMTNYEYLANDNFKKFNVHGDVFLDDRYHYEWVYDTTRDMPPDADLYDFTNAKDKNISIRFEIKPPEDPLEVKGLRLTVDPFDVGQTRRTIPNQYTIYGVNDDNPETWTEIATYDDLAFDKEYDDTVLKSTDSATVNGNPGNGYPNNINNGFLFNGDQQATFRTYTKFIVVAKMSDLDPTHFSVNKFRLIVGTKSET